MELIHKRGLNCCQDCIVSVAADMGVKYINAFSSLWPETEFSYDDLHEVYLSKRLLLNLETLGAKFTSYRCDDSKRTLKILSEHDEKTLIVGMDAFHIPWSPIYKNFHGMHFFIAQKDSVNGYMCFDPTYGKKYMRIDSEQIASFALEIYCAEKVNVKPLYFDVAGEAAHISLQHTDTKQKLLLKFGQCVNENRHNAVYAAKYVDALTNNRRLYRYYLEQTGFTKRSESCDKVLSGDIILRWEGMKNGLYKAYMLKNNERIIEQASRLLSDIIDEEIAMAEEITALCS